MPRRRTPHLILVALATAAVIVACDTSHRSTVQPTITLQQATTQVEQYARDARSHTPANPQLQGPNRTSVACTDPTDAGPPGRVDLADVYTLRFDSQPNNTAILDQLYTYWSSKGYTVLKDTRTDPHGRVIRFENPADGFRFGLVEAVTGPQLTLEVSSPCVWPNGTPPSQY